MSSKLNPLVAEANAFASAHGLQVATGDGKEVSFQTAPISLLPNIIPASTFEQCQRAAPLVNQLIEKVSQDSKFLNACLEEVCHLDPFTKSLLELYNRIYNDDSNNSSINRFSQSADRLGIIRCDYMLHRRFESEPYEAKQVEINTIASSFGSLATKVATLHSYLTERYGDTAVQEWINRQREMVLGSDAITANEKDGVPVNPALDQIPKAIHFAHERYVARNNQSKNSCVVLFIVQDGEKNTVDQRMLEFELWGSHQTPVVRMSLTKGFDNLKLDESNGVLTVVDDNGVGYEVSVVYYRAGYAPTDYPGANNEEWTSRERIELSRATKCPSLGYHLAGTKKVQQELARPGVLERYFPEDAEAVAEVRRVFAGLYSLGKDANDSDLEAVRDVLSGHEGQYVLKPQREGGGYNYYGDRLAEKLKDNIVQNTDGKDRFVLGDALSEYILMERLFPPQQEAILLRNGNLEGTGVSISELGLFGTVVASCDGKLEHNEYSGFLLRTKFANVDEGGVASGFATLSSPYLCYE